MLMIHLQDERLMRIVPSIIYCCQIGQLTPLSAQRKSVFVMMRAMADASQWMATLCMAIIICLHTAIIELLISDIRRVENV